VQVHVVVAPVFATNCCIVVDGDGEEGSDAVVVDAGGGVAASVADVVEQQGWTVRAVLATHGHVDHTWDAAVLCERFGAPFRIHAGDADRLDDPFGSLGLGSPGLAGAVSDALRVSLADLGLHAGEYRAPAVVKPFTAEGDGDGTLVAGSLRIGVVHAPGHTQGSTLFRFDGVAEGGLLLSGDVLFAGGIGRTDLPGGDQEVMHATLRDVVRQLDKSLTVIPGHGPTTTIERELLTNPYL